MCRGCLNKQLSARNKRSAISRWKLVRSKALAENIGALDFDPIAELERIRKPKPKR
jgi:hypothetical protein